MNTDAEDQVLGDTTRALRGVSMVLMRAAELQQRRREQIERRQAEGNREAAQALRDRQNAQRDAARELAKLGMDSRWREAASPRELATSFAWAEAYRGSDELCRMAHEALSEHIAGRHEDIAGFVDEHIRAKDVEQIPAPEGVPSPTQERAAAWAAEGVAPVVVGEERAEQWADLAQEHGRESADQWLQRTLDESEVARMNKWLHWNAAAREAGEERAADAQGERADAVAEAARAEGREGAAESAEAQGEAAQVEESQSAGAAEVAKERGDQQAAGADQFPHTAAEIKDLSSRNEEAARSLSATRPGRARSAAQQVEQAKGKHVRKKKAGVGQGQHADRTQERGR